ncbi:MAG: hypothetical protein U5J83_03495 [Bryobacterales bacterium]|nr:hypothetical protein [Bryobacterales bacterium]
MTSQIFRLVRPLMLALSLIGASTALLAAGVDGTWNLLFMTEAGDRPVVITLKSDGENVSGPVMNQEMKGTFRDGKLSLKVADFYSPDAGVKADLSFEGIVAEGKIQGTWRFAEYSGPMKGELAGAAATANVNVNGVWNFLLITEVGEQAGASHGDGQWRYSLRHRRRTARGGVVQRWGSQPDHQGILRTGSGL